MKTRHKNKQLVDSSVITQFFITNWSITASGDFVKNYLLILNFIKTVAVSLTYKFKTHTRTHEFQNPTYCYAGTIGILSQADAEKLVLNICLIGFAIACYIFTIFSPKLINTLRQRGDKLTSQAQTILLLLLQIFPHVMAVLLLGKIAPQWKTMPAIFLLTVLTQLILVIPTFRAIGRQGKWQPILKISNGTDPLWCCHSSSNAWGSPILFLHLSEGILYPVIFVGYLLSIRYFLLGQHIDLSFLFNLPQEALPIMLYVLSYYPLYFWILIRYLRWRTRLWNQWCTLLDAVNLSAIQIDWVFAGMKRVYLLSQLIFHFTYYNEPDETANLKVKRCAKAFNKLREHMWLITWASILAPISEIILTRHLYYSIYYIFISALIRSIWYLLSKFPETYWEHSLDLSDYLHHNYTRPHIHESFWGFCFDDTDAERVGISWQYPADLQTALQENRKKRQLRYAETDNFEIKKKWPSDKPRRPYIPYLSRRSNPHRQRFAKGSFYRQYAIKCTNYTGLRFNHQFKRYTHTTSVLKSTMSLFNRIKTTFHLNTGYLVPNALCQMLLVQDDFLHVETCRNLQAHVGFYNTNIFKYAALLKAFNNGNPFVPGFIQLQECGLAAHLMSTIRLNSTIYAITPYKEFFAAHARKNTPTSHFLNPDGGTLLTYDEKSHAINKYGPSPNQIVSVSNIQEYLQILKKTKNFCEQRDIDTTALDYYYEQLRTTRPTVEEAFNMYIDLLPGFMDLPYQPPIWVTSHFNVNALSEKARKFVAPSETLNVQISDLLEKHKIPNSTSYHPDLETLKRIVAYNQLITDYRNAIDAIKTEEAELLGGAGESVLAITL